MLSYLLVLSSCEVASTIMQQPFCAAHCRSVVIHLLNPQENPADALLTAVGPDLAHSPSSAISGFARSGRRTEKSRADLGPGQSHAHTLLGFTPVKRQ